MNNTCMPSAISGQLELLGMFFSIDYRTSLLRHNNDVVMCTLK